MEKQWKNFGSVSISNEGDIVSLKYKRPVGWLTKDGYLKVGVSKEGKRKAWSAHRLVYFLFGEDYSEKLEVNHKDGNKLNNSINNLEMCSHSYNMQHAWDNKLMRHSPEGRERIIKSSSIPVMCNETGEIFKSMTDAAKCYNIGKSGISAQIRGKQKTAGFSTTLQVKLTWKLLN